MYIHVLSHSLSLLVLLLWSISYIQMSIYYRLNKIQWNDFEISFKWRCPLFRGYLLYSWIVLYCIETKTSVEVSFNSEYPVFSLFIGRQKVVVSFSRIQPYTSSLLRYCIHNWIPTLGSNSMANKCSLCWVYQPNLSHSRMRVMVKGVASQAR